jgi:predicted nucleic acid-binding protein
MILLDTNVVSEIMRPKPEPNVLSWIATQSIEQLYIASLTVAEIRRGLALLPEGARKQSLHSAFDRFVAQGFEDRILPFTQHTAEVYAPIYASRVKAGLGVGELDLLLAACAAENGTRIATRNVRDFEHTGVKLINPWTEQKL